jgi:hypothetical protein
MSRRKAEGGLRTMQKSYGSCGVYVIMEGLLEETWKADQPSKIAGGWKYSQRDQRFGGLKQAPSVLHQ